MELTSDQINTVQIGKDVDASPDNPSVVVYSFYEE